MCGIIGYIGKQPFDIDKIKVLIMYNLSRGTDSCGFYSPNNGVIKESSSADMFLSKQNIKSDFVFLGHTRAATVGGKTKENAHPFQYDNTYTVHNGTLKNHWSLLSRDKISSKDFNVDSQVLSYYLSKNFDILKEYDGAAAILHYKESTKDILYAYKDSERPLYRGRLGDGFYFSSLEESLYAIGCSKIHELKNGYLYSIRNDGQVQTSKITNKPYHVSYTATHEEPYHDYDSDYTFPPQKTGADGFCISDGNYVSIIGGDYYGGIGKIVNCHQVTSDVFIYGHQKKITLRNEFLINLSNIHTKDYVFAVCDGKDNDGNVIIFKDNIYKVIDKEWDLPSQEWKITCENVNDISKLYTWKSKFFRKLTVEEISLFKTWSLDKNKDKQNMHLLSFPDTETSVETENEGDDELDAFDLIDKIYEDSLWIKKEKIKDGYAYFDKNEARRLDKIISNIELLKLSAI